MKMSNVAVIGCGIIGMTTALAIQKKNPTTNLIIFTKEVSPNTTSDVAAGLWEPFLVSETNEENIFNWSLATYNQLLRWWKEGKAMEYGLCLQPVYYFTDNPDFTLPKWVEHTFGFQTLPERFLKEMSARCKLQLNAGFTFLTFIWEAAIALPRLQAEFIRNGGKIIMKKIDELNELSSFDVIVNCSGFEARELVGDEKIVPIRGQIIKVKADWQLHSKLIDTSTKLVYIIPGTYQCTIGGTATNSSDISVNDIDKGNIQRNCLEISPSLSSVKSMRHVVGIRPGRNKVRLESETINGQNKLLKVVHNYGHGGAGITLSVGCAEKAAELVDALSRKHKL